MLASNDNEMIDDLDKAAIEANGHPTIAKIGFVSTLIQRSPMNAIQIEIESKYEPVKGSNCHNQPFCPLFCRTCWHCVDIIENCLLCEKQEVGWYCPEYEPVPSAREGGE